MPSEAHVLRSKSSQGMPLKTCGQLKTWSFPRLDWTEIGPGSGNILGAGWGILFRVGPDQGVLPGYETFFPGINLHLNEKHAFHSQTEQVE